MDDDNAVKVITGKGKILLEIMELHPEWSWDEQKETADKLHKEIKSALGG